MSEAIFGLWAPKYLIAEVISIIYEFIVRREVQYRNIMRVITPTVYGRKKATKKSRYSRVVFAIFIVLLTFLGQYLYRANSNESYQNNTPLKQEVADSPQERVFRTIGGEEFKDIYNNFNYINTNKILTPPPITGDEAADIKIRILAEARGYRLRRIARSALAEADGYPLQLLAGKYWQELKAEAAKAGIVLTVTSGYRSIEDQREIFLEGLKVRGVSTQDIASGQVDNLITEVLQTYAPPGYSRHHTGFTIDLTCGTNGLTNFVTTICHEWLSRDNYLHAKTFGWAPSYPEGGGLQGPEPEPWEYTWVTAGALLQ